MQPKGRLHIQLVTNETRAFTGIMAYGKFHGVENYFVMVGKKEGGLDERVGYYGETQGACHKIKTIEQVSNATGTSPEWFRRGVEAALLAPTAINQQKFSFLLQPQEENKKPKVLAKKGFSMVGYTKLDLGIAKYNFEIGAGKENFDWV